MVEITRDSTGRPDHIHTHVRVMDYEGLHQTGGIALDAILVAAVDIVGSVFQQDEGDDDEEGFVELVEQLLRATLVDMEVSDLH